ncbi:hypothetical protein BVG16_23145 [Paenibacillus selenitireducens]|uniref:Protein kinase domain-containing protein n=1 Tax=Paenibacillus selenitireducens TaxID=1324314 RepID=A0A1T2X477_9BACL|nr:serine/threonine-protein kinase [Paenibacillus selenitireducens]OPA74657.1 hypothetical protein BVG16_23145 [Paenibacillus selenitireducens]
MKWISKLQVNQVLGGRYRVSQRIGEGGMSYVYVVEDLKLKGKRWAVKETRLLFPGDVAGITAEADMLIQLNHPYLPQIVDFMGPDEDGYMYLFMDYIAGETLAAYFQRMERTLPFEHVLRYALQLCEVLQYLHERKPPIVYRDLKPSNVMMDVHGQIRLIDFGIARQFKPNQEDDTLCLGTVGFAAPEQYAGRQTDARSDLYGLGALLLYLITSGRATKWERDVEDCIPADVPAAFRTVLEQLLQVDSGLRPASALDVHKRFMALGNQSNIITESSSGTRWRGTGTIALTGVDTGTGTTHSAILLAYYLASEKQRIAIIEGIPSQAFRRIHEVYEGGSVEDSDAMFTIRGVDYYPFSHTRNFVSLLHHGYDTLILDLGVSDGGVHEEFLRANLSIIVASGAEWRQPDLIRFAASMSEYRESSRWVYFIPLAASQTIKDVMKATNQSNVHGIPYHSDPFQTMEATSAVLSHIVPLDFVSPQHKKGFGKFLFSRRSRRNVKN